MSESWDDYADGWDSDESVKTYSELAYRSLLKEFNPQECRIFDFGCGTGLLTEKLSRHAVSIVALDPSEKMIAVLNDKGLQNVTTITSELHQQLIDSSEIFTTGFDLIVASSALAFVADYEQSLRLLKQLLKPGGLFIQWDWLKHENAEGRGFSKLQILSAFEKAGFTECTTSIPFSLASEHGSMEVIMGIGRTD
ncbi:class I SAM-dependent methyltransferase [Mariprofundus sp. KV]|uniref:class I SAM-dependent DNA methyltransferase n=1 Tax=Mariprofundus sp. KV TaxID=2608715 RepID=UPI0015A39B28|nr:class I SAM-dependent methyltransferase [Mariprofundus sp. KV]NWF37373.1 class I SAM-dependent methyltransferase [Mariprofundus sp. KV]